jgi:hypothetical protein
MTLPTKVCGRLPRLPRLMRPLESGPSISSVETRQQVVSIDEAAAEVRDVLDSIGDTCPECP